MKELEEEWRDVVGWEGLYKVSNLGNVHSNFINRLLNPFLESSGRYRVVGLTDRNMRTRQIKIARLVATAFIPNPDNKPIVDHRDRDTTNDCLYNLRWATSKENNNNSQSNSACYMCDKSTGTILKHFETQAQAAEYLGDNKYRKGIAMCITGRNKTAYGYVWKYAGGE